MLVLVKRVWSLHRPKEGAAETPKCLSQTHLRGPGPGVPHHWGRAGLGTTGMSLLALLLVPQFGNTGRGGRWAGWDRVWCPGCAAGGPGQNLQGVEEAKGRVRPPSAQVPSAQKRGQGRGPLGPPGSPQPGSKRGSCSPCCSHGHPAGLGSVYVCTSVCLYTSVRLYLCVRLYVCVQWLWEGTPRTPRSSSGDKDGPAGAPLAEARCRCRWGCGPGWARRTWGSPSDRPRGV